MILVMWRSTEDVFVDPPTFEPLEECRRVLFHDVLLVLGDICKELRHICGCVAMVFFYFIYFAG